MSNNDLEIVQLKKHILKLQINCDGCKMKVKKLLQKIEGVYQVYVDMEEGTATISGNIDCATLIRKLEKSGKHAEVVQSESSYLGQNGGRMSAWLKDGDTEDQMQTIQDGYNASFGQNTLSPMLGNEYGQLDFDNYSNNMGNSSRGIPSHNYGTAREIRKMDWDDRVVPDRGIIRGITNSIRGLGDFDGLSSEFSGFEDEGFPRLQSLYSQMPAYECYPPFMMGSNLNHYLYDNPIAFPTNYDLANMQMRSNLNHYLYDNPIAFPMNYDLANMQSTEEPSTYMPRYQRMVNPMIHAFPINAHRPFY